MQSTNGSVNGSSNGSVAAAPALTPAQVQRYSRHLIMPNVGSAGQRALVGAKVLVVGAAVSVLRYLSTWH